MADVFRFRTAGADDRDAFLDMSREFYASDAVLHDVVPAFHEKAFAELLRSGTYLTCYIFTCGNQTAGYALLSKMFSREFGGMVVWIEEAYVRPAFQGRGVGGTFFRWLRENVPAAAYRLEVEPSNVRARRLYARLGFSELPYVQMVIRGEGGASRLCGKNATFL